jgi:hypothetical protein
LHYIRAIGRGWRKLFTDDSDAPLGWRFGKILFAFLAAGMHLFAQYDKVAALGSDTSITPMGGPASAPPIENWPYDLPDFRPTGRLNDQLPRWLQFGLEERFRFEGYQGGGFNPKSEDAYLLNRLRIGTIIRPVSWFRIVAQTQDARSFFQTPPIGPPNTVRWDLKVAYAEFGDAETQPFSLRVGRQAFDFNSTILAASEWRNQGRSFDGVVARLRRDRFRAAIFAGSAVIPLAAGISHHQEGNNIYGIYGGFDRVLPHSAVEPFVIWRVAPRLDEKVYGFRVRGREISGFDYRAEWIGERGTASGEQIQAWATTFGVGYRAAPMHWRPRLFGGYDYASGDKNPQDGNRGTFDSIYSTAHDRFGISDQFGWQNIVAGRVGATVEPHHRWSVTGQYLNFWLAQSKDAIYNSSGLAIFRDSSGRSGGRVGEEVDLYSWYEVNREVHVGLGVGHIIPGRFLRDVSKGGGYTYPYFAVEMLDGKRVH